MVDPAPAGGEDEQIYRWRPGTDPAEPAVVLLHGRTGDETVMWVVAEALPTAGWMISPRAPFPTTDGGFSWSEPAHAGKSKFEDFDQGVAALRSLLDRLSDERGIDRRRMILVGFSQGAALAFAVARHGHLQPLGIVALAGFLPDGDPGPLRAIPIFWGHGTRDTRVPIETARVDVEKLRRAGASVQFCEADVEHRVGVECMRGLKQWWISHFGSPDDKTA
jgi:predicted esterase